jgi:hypothetical protein
VIGLVCAGQPSLAMLGRLFFRDGCIGGRRIYLADSSRASPCLRHHSFICANTKGAALPVPSHGSRHKHRRFDHSVFILYRAAVAPRAAGHNLTEKLRKRFSPFDFLLSPIRAFTPLASGSRLFCFHLPVTFIINHRLSTLYFLVGQGIYYPVYCCI